MHARTRAIAALCCALSLAGCQPKAAPEAASAGWDAPACLPEFDALRARIEVALNTLELSGGAFLVRRGGRTLCEAYFGLYDETTAVPLVSAVKWLSAATVLSLVDDGRLALDDPVSKFLPYFSGVRGTITVRQLLSHTSGLPDYSACMFDKALTLDDCAREIAGRPLLARPGAQFNYGGTAYTVAGRVAEVAGGKPWNDLFAERVAGPLGLEVTNYGETQNPILSEGYAISSLREYATFLEMLLAGGTRGGRRVLSQDALEEMARDQMRGAEVGFSPGGADTSYGLGVWRGRIAPDGTAGELSSPGGGGFVPWIDLERGLLGIFMVFDRIERVGVVVEQVRRQAAEIADALAPPPARARAEE